MVKNRTLVPRSIWRTFLATCAACYVGAASATLPIQAWSTESGANVLFMQAEALPMLDVSVAFPAGDRADPEGQAGLANLVAGLLGTGAEGLNEQQIADGFANTGAQFSAGASQDFASVSLRTLTTAPEYECSVSLLARVLQKPVFKKNILERELKQSITNLKESLTRPDTLASRAFAQALYPQHPYGRLVTEESLTSIDQQSIDRFYQTHYLGNHAVVVMVGDLKLDQAKALAEQLTKGLPVGEQPATSIQKTGHETLQAQMQGVTKVISHPAAQSHIMLGLPAVVRGDADYFNLLVANHVLGGGGFTSRLMKTIRDDNGLAYSTYSYFIPRGDAGPFQSAVQTKKEQTEQALELMQKTIGQFIAEGPNEQELIAAKSNLIDGFPLRIDSNSELVANLVMMGVYNMPLDYLDTWTTQIQQVTQESAHQAFVDYVSPEKLVTIVVGPETLKSP